jgi:hypothetical protein
MQKNAKNTFFLNPLLHKIGAGEKEKHHLRAPAYTKTSPKLNSKTLTAVSTIQNLYTLDYA